MRLFGHFIALLLLCTLAACASEPSRFRGQALGTLQRVKLSGGETLFPAEFGSLRDAFEKGESLLKEEDDEDAESYFQLTLLKGSLLERELGQEQARRKEAARLVEQEKKAELERRAQEEAKTMAVETDKQMAVANAIKRTKDENARKLAGTPSPAGGTYPPG